MSLLFFYFKSSTQAKYKLLQIRQGHAYPITMGNQELATSASPKTQCEADRVQNPHKGWHPRALF